MERLERLKDNTVELTEEQKEFDVYDDELLNNILNTPKSETKPANKLDDMEIQLADDDEMDELFGKPNKQEDNKQEDNKQEENKQEIDHKPQYVPQNGQKIMNTLHILRNIKHDE